MKRISVSLDAAAAATLAQLAMMEGVSQGAAIRGILHSLRPVVAKAYKGHLLAMSGQTITREATGKAIREMEAALDTLLAGFRDQAKGLRDDH